MVDVISQILFATITKISLEMSIGLSRDSFDSKIMDFLLSLTTYSDKLQVTRLKTLDIWKLQPQLPLECQRGKPKHLVILTYVIH